MSNGNSNRTRSSYTVAADHKIFKKKTEAGKTDLCHPSKNRVETQEQQGEKRNRSNNIFIPSFARVSEKLD